MRARAGASRPRPRCATPRRAAPDVDAIRAQRERPVAQRVPGRARTPSTTSRAGSPSGRGHEIEPMDQMRLRALPPVLACSTTPRRPGRSTEADLLEERVVGTRRHQLLPRAETGALEECDLPRPRAGRRAGRPARGRTGRRGRPPGGEAGPRGTTRRATAHPPRRAARGAPRGRASSRGRRAGRRRRAAGPGGSIRRAPPPCARRAAEPTRAARAHTSSWRASARASPPRPRVVALVEEVQPGPLDERLRRRPSSATARSNVARVTGTPQARLGQPSAISPS